MRLGKVFINAGFVIFFSILCFILGFEFIAIILFAILTHEAGHILAIVKLGGSLKEIRLEIVGVLIRYDGRKMSYIAELITAFAGPFASLVLALLAAF